MSPDSVRSVLLGIGRSEQNMRIGVSGHQDLGSKHSIEWVRTHIEKELAKRDFHSGISSLAEGTDQLFAQIVLDLGKQLEVIVPCHDYETAFQNSIAAAKFLQLKR